MFQSSGVVHYDTDNVQHPKLVVLVDTELARYYRSLLPKSIKINLPLYAPHISVVRKEAVVSDKWGIYEGRQIQFYYDGVVHMGTVYCWLNIFSVELEAIRLELGLPVHSPYTLPPEGFKKCFHCTLGNFKGLTK